MHDNYDYDVIIIGAGISGLVCGCYLAKAGLKTLIVEKNHQPGGYCTSFYRQGYRFDACVHGLGSLRKGGRLREVLEELGLESKIKFYRNSPSDKVITPDFVLNIFNRYDQICEEFNKIFPHSKKRIDRLIDIIVKSPISELIKLRNTSFSQLLDYYLEDERLKAIFSVIILSLTGVFPHELSALVGCLVYREFVFDGGYYPEGGIQCFTNTLSSKFREFGGDLILGREVFHIHVVNYQVDHIDVADRSFRGRVVISACDITHTFFELIGKESLDKIDAVRYRNIRPSLSAFLVYLGMKQDIKNEIASFISNIWIISNYDLEEVYKRILRCENDFIAITSPYAKNKFNPIEYPSLTISAIVPYKDDSFWNDERMIFSEKLIRIAHRFYPFINDNIVLKIDATPFTLYRWTRNYQGAAYGLASSLNQFGNPDISQITRIKNLYLTGHWTNLGSGITSVVNCGYDVAKIVVNKLRKG